MTDYKKRDNAYKALQNKLYIELGSVLADVNRDMNKLEMNKKFITNLRELVREILTLDDPEKKFKFCGDLMTSIFQDLIAESDSDMENVD